MVIAAFASLGFLGKNPFGHSSTNLGPLFKGVVRDMFTNFERLRKTKHTHHPVDDARGNAEALLQIKEEYGLNIRLEGSSVSRCEWQPVGVPASAGKAKPPKGGTPTKAACT